MNLTRRDFLGLKITRATETRSTCPYCSASCGVILYRIQPRSPG